MPECFGCGEDVALLGDGRLSEHGVCPESYALPDGDMFRCRSEARFTAPRGDCPHPERWHSADCDSAEFEVTALVAAFAGALRPDIAVETGSAWGQTSEAIGRALADAPVGKLYTLEPDAARAEAAEKRCVGLPVEVVQRSSMKWTPPGPVGFAWLDSRFELRVPEFRRLYRHFIPGAIVGFHDTGPHRGQLRGQIEGLEADGMLLPVHLPTPRGVTFGEVVK